MKKVLSVILAVCMVFTFVPFLALAAGETELTNDNLPANYLLVSGIDYVVSSGNTLTIPAGATLQVVEGSTLTVKEGGKLILNGSMVVPEGGKFVLEGQLENPGKLSGEGEKLAKITFPALSEFNMAGKLQVSYATSYSGSAYDDNEGGSLEWTPVADAGEAKYIPLNQYVYIIAHIIEPNANRDKFEDALVKVFLNNVEIPYTQGNHHTLLSVAGKISYNVWTNDNDFLKTYRIDLPAEREGYTVIGREGEVGATDKTVYIKYGKPFAFRVELDEAYDKSPVKVYIVSGYGLSELDTLTLPQPAEPDQYGYYNIPSVEGDYTVFVMGVIANQTVQKVGGIFEQVKSIFEMIRKFFAQFLALFGIDA